MGVSWLSLNGTQRSLLNATIHLHFIVPNRTMKVAVPYEPDLLAHYLMFAPLPMFFSRLFWCVQQAELIFVFFSFIIPMYTIMEWRKFINKSRANWVDFFVERAKYLRIKHNTTIHKESVNLTKFRWLLQKPIKFEQWA